jgi:hypothetical protein
MSSTENLSRKSIGSARNPESHEAILEAAEDVFCEAGYAGFSIEAVARRARAGKPTIYRRTCCSTSIPALRPPACPNPIPERSKAISAPS